MIDFKTFPISTTFSNGRTTLGLTLSLAAREVLKIYVSCDINILTLKYGRKYGCTKSKYNKKNAVELKTSCFL